MKCKTCGEDKEKNPVIRGKHVRFSDSNGKIWNGKDCADCYKIYNMERMRRTRKEKIKNEEVP